MSATEVIKDLKAKKFKPLYLLQGEEPYYIDQVVDYMENNILNDGERGFNQTVLYGKDTDMATILNAAKRYPMMSDYQLIVVKEAQDLRWSKETEGSSKEAEFIQNYFENKSGYNHDNRDITHTFNEFGTKLMAEPKEMAKVQELYKDFFTKSGKL